MWLLGSFSLLAGAATRMFYRLTVAGFRVPPVGPVLLVANHPNSLIDPAVVAAVAGRPVRFLARAPLFENPQIGWLVRASGAIPVYRPAESSGAAALNREMFSAVQAALTGRGEGGESVVGIFPEGLSHDEPALAPLRTGAARIALGAAELSGAAFHVMPIGLVYREKERFRSEALAVIGEPVHWDDLGSRGAADTAAVRELTARLDSALRSVTVNLERWEDAKLVEWAEAIHAAEMGVAGDAASRIARVRQVTETLARLRRDGADGPTGHGRGDAAWTPLAQEISAHGRMLERLGLEPRDIARSASVGETFRTVFSALTFAGLTSAVVALAGQIIFWPPYRAAGAIADRTAERRDTLATHRLLYGVPVFIGWIVLLSVLIAVAGGALAGALALVLLPLLGVVALLAGERRSAAWADLWRLASKHGRRSLLARLREQQREIAARLQALR
ncbi:MAG: lysophospholipid acyltransferase family protein [Gemmatimonadaceae bacterium]